MTTQRRDNAIQIWLVLGLSLGQSAIYAIVSLTAKLTAGPLRDATATLNASRSSREWLDLTYQLLSIGFALVPVLLALYLLSRDRVNASVMTRLGLQPMRAGHDALAGVVLGAVIGLPGLAFYFAGRALGITAEIITSPAEQFWWTIPVLIVAAVQNALLEEIIVVGFLFIRLAERGWQTASVIVASALLRGSYHLYQGIGPGIGNVIMGLVFGYWYTKTRRLGPLIVAHAILDIVAFAGYALFAESLGLK